MSIPPEQNSSSKAENSEKPSLAGSPNPSVELGDSDSPPSAKPSPHPKPENPWVEAVKTIGLSLILALGIRQFVAEARYIPSESMVPTLEVNDRLMVEKVSYLVHPPERGDIVVFWPPDIVAEVCQGQQGPSKPKDAFIKRVVGLPGDKIDVRGGQVFINDQLIEENYIKEEPNYQYPPQVPSPGVELPEVVPSNSYFVMGDNRNNSCDSHMWGVVPRENIIGRAAFRFWPLDRLGGIGN
jgi:signal peptidase I